MYVGVRYQMQKNKKTMQNTGKTRTSLHLLKHYLSTYHRTQGYAMVGYLLTGSFLSSCFPSFLFSSPSCPLFSPCLLSLCHKRTERFIDRNSQPKLPHKQRSTINNYYLGTLPYLLLSHDKSLNTPWYYHRSSPSFTILFYFYPK